MQPLSYFIVQTSYCSHPQSRINYQRSQQNWSVSQSHAQQWSWPYTVWPAVDGYTVDSSYWARSGLRLLDRGAIRYRPGAQGCWFSHWGLWQHCRDQGQPIIVLEHDARIQNSWTDLDLDLCVWKLHRPDGRGEEINTVTGAWSRGAWAYTLTPSQADQLIEFTLKNGVQAVDKQIGAQAVTWQYLNCDLVRHQPRIPVSTTSPKIPLTGA